MATFFLDAQPNNNPQTDKHCLAVSQMLPLSRPPGGCHGNVHMNKDPSETFHKLSPQMSEVKRYHGKFLGLTFIVPRKFDMQDAFCARSLLSMQKSS